MEKQKGDKITKDTKQETKTKKTNKREGKSKKITNIQIKTP